MGTITNPTGSITTPSGDPGTLPPATVPLVGTELMEIYEGGAWKYLTTDNFTAGRVINTGGVNVTGTDIPLNGIYESATNTVGIATDGALRVSVSTTSVATPLPMIVGSPPGSAVTIGDDLVVGAAGNGGMSVIVPDANLGGYYIGSPSDNEGFFMRWSFNSAIGSVSTSKIGAVLNLSGDNEVPNLALSGASGSEMATFVRHVAMTNGNLTLSAGDLIISAATTPASAGAAGTQGTVAWDTDYMYVCIATNTWKRVAIATW